MQLPLLVLLCRYGKWTNRSYDLFGQQIDELLLDVPSTLKVSKIWFGQTINFTH